MKVSLREGTLGHKYWVSVSCGTQGRALMLKKNMKYVAIAFVLFYLFSQPGNAARVVNNAFSLLGDAGNSLAQFVNQLG
jgi:hypothetical protein